MSKIDLTQHPPFVYSEYKSSLLRGPKKPLVKLQDICEGQPRVQLGERQGGLTNQFSVSEIDNNLLLNSAQGGEPFGERMVVSGKVLDRWGHPQPGVLIEIWQANASGRYRHKTDEQNAPLDPNFSGVGRCITDPDGEYRFYTVKPGAYPWKNHPNAWRPSHIHFSVIGESLADRLITQMYFSSDPLLEYDPIFTATPQANKLHLISKLDLSLAEADFALGYKFDIILNGAKVAPADSEELEQPSEHP